VSTIPIPASETLRAYDRWAAHYDDDPNPLVAATAWVLAQAPLAVAGARVLELGCGTGRHAAGLLAAGARAYVGVDGSDGMLEVARAKQADPRARWITAELTALPPPARLDEAPCQVALIVLVLEHLTELDGLLGGAARWLLPGATLRIVELHPERIAAGTVAHYADGGVEHRFASVAHDEPAVRAALGRTGFVDVTTRTWLADAALVAAVPRLAKHAGRPVVLDVSACAGPGAVVPSGP
jgi:SAM-dependent methyltransferase